eukprot:2166217-Rhodomonas_salina.1
MRAQVFGGQGSHFGLRCSSVEGSGFTQRSWGSGEDRQRQRQRQTTETETETKRRHEHSRARQGKRASERTKLTELECQN